MSGGNHVLDEGGSLAVNLVLASATDQDAISAMMAFHAPILSPHRRCKMRGMKQKFSYGKRSWIHRFKRLTDILKTKSDSRNWLYVQYASGRLILSPGCQ